ncbi:hypothetical protein F4814DRAFT_428315 [Daldinia grandis]|nr:hypothetical protein F4814DRAFT_428315 [Daldinia grandis]
MESDLEDLTAPGALEDDIVMDEVRKLSHQYSDPDAQDECDLDDSHTKETSDLNAGDSQEQEEVATSRLYPIVVVLHPPPDPTIYERIYPSQTVERILDEMEDEDGELYYSIEFEDGYIEDAYLMVY